MANEFLRDQWKAASDTLSRIKQGEQRWLSVALWFFGALIGVILFGKGSDAFEGYGTCARFWFFFLAGR